MSLTASDLARSAAVKLALFCGGRERPVPDMPDAGMKGACNMNETHYRNGISCRKPRNEAEGMLYEQMSAQGWALTKRGWPDFFCIKGDDICVVEVKPRAKTPLKPNQRIIMEKLKAYGVKCYRWDPDTGLTEI